MLNASWGKTFWQLLDYYLVPTGGFYGSQKACESIHCQYSYDDDSIWLLNYEKKNDGLPNIRGITQQLLLIADKKFGEISVLISVYDKNSQIIYREEIKKTVSHGQKVKLSNVKLNKIKDDFFILKLDYSGKSNVYWLTKSKDEFEKKHTPKNWFYRPQTQYADLSPILSMHRTSLETQVDSKDKEAEIFVKNSGKYFAAAVQLDFLTENGELCYPVYFSQNLFWLAPNEEIKITAKIPAHSQFSFDKLKLKCEAANA